MSATPSFSYQLSDTTNEFLELVIDIFDNTGALIGEQRIRDYSGVSPVTLPLVLAFPANFIIRYTIKPRTNIVVNGIFRGANQSEKVSLCFSTGAAVPSIQLPGTCN